MEPTSEELLRALDMQAYAAHKSEPEANVLDPNKENIHKLVQMSRDDLKREDPDRYRRYLKAWLKMKTDPYPIY